MTDDNINTTGENEDMFKIRDMFSRAADAILAATKLRKDVDTLQESVNRLSNELEAVRAHNTWLEQQLEETKKDRDQWRDKFYVTETELSNVKRDLESATTLSEHRLNSIRESSELAERFRRDLDEKELALMQRDDELRAANERIAKIKAVIEVAADELQTLLHPPQAVAPPIVEPDLNPVPVFEEQIRDPETGQFGPKVAQGF